MHKGDVNLMKYLGYIFLALILTYRLPQNPYSIIQNIIPPIQTSNGVLYLSGIVPIILIILGTTGLFKLERFSGQNNIFIFIVVIVLIIPLMRWTLDITRTAYHLVRDDGLKAIDIEDSNISLSGSDIETIIKVNLELKNYSKKDNIFKIRIYYPESIKKHMDKNFYEFDGYHSTHGRRNKINIEEKIELDLDENETDELFESEWFWEDIEYELYNDDESIIFIQPGI